MCIISHKKSQFVPLLPAFSISMQALNQTQLYIPSLHTSFIPSIPKPFNLNITQETHQTPFKLQMTWHDLVRDNICKGNERLKQVIRTRTGLSPAMFFAVVTIVTTTAAASIALISSFISPPTHVDPDKKPGDRDSDDTEIFPEAMQVGEISEEELRMYDGSDPEKPILTAIKGHIYDVSKSSMFYGPGGPYELFAGKDHSRALAKMSFEPADVTGDLSGLEPDEIETLDDWEVRFMSKYTKVGTIVKKRIAESVKSSEGSTCHHDDISSTSSESDSEGWQGLHDKEDKAIIGSHHQHDP